MRLRVLVDDRSAWRDLLLDVGPDHTVAELASALATHLALDPAGTLYCESQGRVIDPTIAIADSGLRWGDRLVLDDRGPGEDGPPVPLRRLVVESGPDVGRQLLLSEGDHDVGRSPSMALPIDDAHLSRRHLRIEVASTGVTVTDLGSSNGTTIDGRPVTDPAALRPDDLVVAGASLLRLRPPPPPPSARTARDGRVSFQRPPRAARPAAVPTVRMPTPGSGGRLRGALAAARAALGRVPGPDVPPAAPYDQYPGPQTLIDRTRALHPSLWERRPDDDDFLDLRVGWGTAGGQPSVPRSPLVVGLSSAGSLGITCGDDHVRRRVLRWQVAQLAGLHSPDELRLAVIGDASDTWDWATWLPHTAGVDGPEVVTGPEAAALVARLTDRVATRRGRTDDRHLRIVLAIDDDTDVDATAVTQLARDGPDVGVHVLWSGHEATQDMAVLDVDPTTGRGTIRGSGATVPVDGVDGLRSDVALELALGLAGVRDVSVRGATTPLPQAVQLLELLDLPDPHEAAVRDRWDRADDGLTMTLGATANGPLVVDLVEHGPHALLGGAQPDALDELVRSLVAALAADHPPRRLQLHLLDPAGRGTLQDCVQLPHVVAHGTNGEECRAGLTAVVDELSRRRTLLDSAAAADVTELEGRSDGGTLARLVLVVAGAEQVTADLADLLRRIIGSAAGLGVHVVLATTDPTSTTATLPLTPGLRVALRTARPGDDDVLLGSTRPAPGADDPAGRGHVRIGEGPVQAFQTGAVTGPADPADMPETVAVHDVVAGRPVPGRSTTTIARERVTPASDLSRLVAACRTADAAMATRTASDAASSADPAAAAGAPGHDGTGAVEVERTFLFSDVVRSTALVDAIGDEHWLRLVQWHDVALTDQVERHGGDVVEHTGDGFFVAFRDPAAALSCAVDIQRMLHRHRIEAGFAPEVRIGVHHTTVRHDGRYRGRGVHVAARIAALAEGGEVLASVATLALAPQVATGPTRTEELRGISTPVPVASVRIDP